MMLPYFGTFQELPTGQQVSNTIQLLNKCVSNTNTINSKGTDKRKFPLLGLAEIGNFKCGNPQNVLIEACIGDPLVRLTFVQYYTPCTNTIPSDLLKEHPFLITYMPGLDFIKSSPHFAPIAKSVDKLFDIESLRESITNCLTVGARFEFAVTASSAGVLSTINMACLRRRILQNNLIVQVSILFCIIV